MTSGTRIAVVEDHGPIARAVSKLLTDAGYEVTIYTDGRLALNGLSKNPCDLVLLDIQLPGMSGWEVLRHLRQCSQVPVTMLTATEPDEIAAALAFKMGAVDFLRKPFGGVEHMARVEAAIGRNEPVSPPTPPPSVRKCGNLLLHEDHLICKWKGANVKLSRAQFYFLWTLAQDPRKPRSPDDLRKATSVEFIGEIIEQLRTKFGSKTAVENVFGIGYKLGHLFLEA